jgi:hypothetical protein
MVSDGGLKRKSGSYGAVIGNRHIELIHNQGIAHGYYATNSSFRSEAYGMLSACTLLNEIVKYLSLHIPADKPLSIFTDNLGLVNRIRKHRTGPLPISLMQAPDVDLELQIREELHHLSNVGFTSSVNHVLGHQDADRPFHRLSRPAQLNMIADELATDAYIPTPSTEYYAMPAVKAHLSIAGIPITSKIALQLRVAARSPDLLEYMQIKFNWATTTSDNIWWPVHDKALKNQIPEDGTRLQKFNFDRLPTNHRESNYYDHIQDFCSECGAANENDDHVIRCIAAARAPMRCQCLREVSNFLSGPTTPPQVRTVIIEGLKASWLTRHPIPALSLLVPDASAALQQAYDDQWKIVWRHFVRGRLSLSWGILINHFLLDQKLDEKAMTPECWGIKVVSIIWCSVVEIWTHRNNVEHGSTPEQRLSIRRAKLIAEIKTIQDSDPAVSYIDREWLSTPSHDLESFAVCKLLEWLSIKQTPATLSDQS